MKCSYSTRHLRASGWVAGSRYSFYPTSSFYGSSNSSSSSSSSSSGSGSSSSSCSSTDCFFYVTFFTAEKKRKNRMCIFFIRNTVSTTFIQSWSGYLRRSNYRYVFYFHIITSSIETNSISSHKSVKFDP